jgi:hypothetical protein
MPQTVDHGEFRFPATSVNIPPARKNRHERGRKAKLGAEADATAGRNQASPGIGHNQPPEPLEDFEESGELETPRREKLKPALISISEAAEYVNHSRSGFYKSILPDLETVTLGKRRLVVMASLDAFVERLRSTRTPVEPAKGGRRVPPRTRLAGERGAP